MQELEKLLRERIGLDAASVGAVLIHRMARLRMKSCGIKRVEDYMRLLSRSETEWKELIEAVVVTETWFFRDKEPFVALLDMVKNEWLPAHESGPVRVLCAPCSSGEEPYSVAMAFEDEGIPADRVQIEAVDISERALERARAGIFGKNSFRGKDLAFRMRHFTATEDAFELKPAIRDRVTFRQANLLTEAISVAPYDFVFCRNLLIYFDEPTRKVAVAQLERLLAPAGVLFVGAAELPLVLDRGFVSAQIPMAFACRKGVDAAPVPRRRARAPDAARLKPVVLRPPPGPVPGQATIAVSPTTDSKVQTVDGEDLARARQLADAGKLEDAAAICEERLRQGRATAEAYYLLGLVHDAKGEDRQAEEFYRRALYLDPCHYESLVQLSLWCQRKGDTTRARTLKTRAQRARAKS